MSYLKAENQILRSRLPERLIITHREKNRLVRFAKNLGSALNELATIVHPSTIRRWIRDASDKVAKTRKNVGRPRTAEQIEKLILKLAKDNSWGYTRILGELKKLGIESVTRNTVKNILKRNGYDVGPKRGPGTWDEFIKRHAKTMWQCDFYSKKVVSKTGLRDLFVLVFLHLETRRVFITPASYHPDEAWVLEQAEAFKQHVKEEKLSCKLLMHDRDTVPPIEILRHRAAIRRTEPSLPLKCLVRDNLLTDGTTFFDYGCGYGDDLEQIKRLGFVANGWDPAYRPDEAVCEADVVNLGYVINVIEDQSEREETLRAAWRLAKRVFAVAARIAVDGSGDGEFEFGDGVITRIQTFQKYYSQAELRQYLEQILGAEAIPAAPGVFYLFKDASLRESFSASKYRRRSFAPRRRASEVEFDRHRELLEDLIRISADLARLPFEDEFDRTEEVIATFGSLKRAFKLIRKVTGSDPWDTLRQSRIDDLRVYLALARFPKRPSFSQMPVGMQRDIKEFFGGYKSACDSADVLLFESGRTELVDAACQRSKIGQLTSNALYLHRSAIPSLEPILRVFEGCANAYLGDVEDANIVKLHRFSGKISYLACPKFETHPHPPIRRTIKLSLRNLFLQCIDHTENKNPLLLDRKERMIEPDHPWQQRFARFSLLEAQHGLIDGSEDMLSALQWHTKLQEAGLMIKGNRLRYQDGVKRKRLPPKRLFSAPQDDTKDQVLPQALPDVETDSELHDATAIEAIDSDLEDLASTSDSRPAELPARSRRFGVGKEIGYAVYVHRDYEDLLGQTVEWAKRHLPEHYEYRVVKLNQRNDSVSFIQCPGFDVEHEPVITAIIVVNATGQVQRRTTPADPYIYHHKWLFVDDDYQGFDVAESIARSKQWIALGDVDRSRIGRKSYWEANVVPRIFGMLIPRDSSSDLMAAPEKTSPPEEGWYASSEIRRLLKISTCDLAHLRESNQIQFKKVGRAYHYRISPNEDGKS